MSTEQKLLAVCMQMGLDGGKSTPILLVGPPGIGKTDIVKHIARNIAEKRELGFPVETYPCPQLAAEDLGGAPVPDLEKGYCRMLPNIMGRQLLEEGAGVLFLDEISSAPAAVGAAALTTIQNGIIGEKVLSDRVARVAAMNPVEQAANGRDLSPPEANRFCWVQYEVSTSDWVDYMMGGQGAARDVPILPKGWESKYGRWAKNLVTAYITRNPSSLLDMPPVHNAGQAWPSPRSWENASRLLAACKSIGSEPSDELSIMAVSGCVGEKALEFLTWVTEADLPDPEDFLANPEKELPKRSDRLHATLNAIVFAAIDNKEHPKCKERYQTAWQIVGRVFKTKQDACLQAAKLLAKAHDPKDALPMECAAFHDLLCKVGITDFSRI